MKYGHRQGAFPLARTTGVLLVTVALLSAGIIGGRAQNSAAAKSRSDHSKSRLTEDQRVLHVLNRLGFGARPGDVAHVKAIGPDSYIEQQLHPEKINDAVAEAKVRDLATLKMTTAELYEKYPQPGQLLRQLERRGELPAELGATRRDRRSKDEAPASQPNAGAVMEMPATPPATPEVTKKKEQKASDTADPRDNQKYRQAIRQYYMENGLQPPQRISAELQASRILRAVYSERQLEEVMVDFWTNHFNVFAGKGADRWLLVSYDRDTIRPNAMGKFSDLLLATAESPAMLFYLDNFQSVSPTAQLGVGNRGQGGPLAQMLMGERIIARRQLRMTNNPEQQRPQQQARRGINENYARELMELHTLGVDGGYTQKDVQEVARCFTGWTIFAPRGAGAAAQAIMDGPRAERLRENAGRFFFNPRAHDDGEKVVLGQKIPAGGGMKDGLVVLDILAHHPATARFIATKLVRHFVADEAPAGLVDRVAAAFSKSDGDISATLRAIFFSPEFNSQQAYRAKVKRPFELTISAIRTLGGETNGGPQLHQWIARMGEPLYGFQTPNGYSDTAESWVNAGGLLERLNFGLMLASNRIPGTRVDLHQFLSSDGQAPDKIMERFLNLIVAGDIAPKTKEVLMKQLNEQTALIVPAMTRETLSTNQSLSGDEFETQRPQRQGQQPARAGATITDPVTKIVGLILGSPEFQRQ
ncbi:MAG TPA: DUF1800 domain-containing protein [Pyrinomonadaceae bacterium]|nr:DUF1800 domain-containing protein [Pyrinomonadaceae bacterium]